MNEETKISFEVIFHAGNSKTSAMNAMEAAENGMFEKAEELIEEAQLEANRAHLAHKNLLDKIVNGEMITMDLLMTHALDHMTSAEDMIIVAQRLISLYKKLMGGKKND